MVALADVHNAALIVAAAFPNIGTAPLGALRV